MATDRNHAFTMGSFDIPHTLQEEIKDESCGGIDIEYNSCRFLFAAPVFGKFNPYFYAL
jgi:hypothetical protein